VNILFKYVFIGVFVIHLNHPVKEIEGNVVRIYMYHDTIQKHRYIMIRFLGIDIQSKK
jgi:hypothetical protein